MAKSDRKLHEARMAGAAWLMNVHQDTGYGSSRERTQGQRSCVHST